MKQKLSVILILAFAIAAPIQTMAKTRLYDGGVSVSIPPSIQFGDTLDMIVIPGTYIYADPDLDEALFFYDGLWWCPWDGRWWYCSLDGTEGWMEYQNVPSFYIEIPSDWRSEYRQHRWKGNEWNYERIPYQKLQQNWSKWKNDNYWEKQSSWGVKELNSGTQTPTPSREVRPQSQERSNAGEMVQTQPSRSTSGEVREERAQPQQLEEPTQSESQRGSSENSGGEKKGRN